MPGGDRTGPEGLGSMTGKRMGYCVGNDNPNYSNQTPIYGRRLGRGFSRNFGFGRGIRFGFGRSNRFVPNENIPNVSQKTELENEIKILKDQLSFLEKQLSETKNED